VFGDPQVPVGDVKHISGTDDVRVWTQLAKIRVVGISVDGLVIGKAIVMGNARQTFSLLYSVV
jgi:hypothetical protein